jgi:exonuclease SbcC
MRPLKLHVKGFTAFRDEAVLDFADLDVFAISGPTGSGKSSLLDAMTYALFGRVERVGDRVGQLISQGQPRMAVTLEFEVGTDRYRVTRSTSSKGVSKILLERGLGEGWQQAGEGADRIREAEPMIRHAVGLTYDGFTRSVLLPQGKFQEFVVGDPVKRRAILTELLGLTLFRGMAERAGAMARDANVQAETTARILEAEYADATPQALAEARAAAREAGRRQKAWAKAGKRVLALFEEWVEAGRSAQELRECRVDAAAAAERARSTAEELAALASEGVASDRAVAAAGAAAERAATESQSARVALAEAQRTLGTVEGLTEAQGLAHALAQARRGRSDHTSSSAGLQDKAKALGETLSRAESVLADRQQALAERAAARERTEAVLEEARHADLVAAVAQGHGPGDPCPVCGTTLVAAPPKPSVSLETAKARCAKAVRAYEQAGTEAATAERTVEGLRMDLEANRDEQARSAADLAGLDAAIESREAELAAVLGPTVPDDPTAEVAARLAEIRRLEVAERDAQQAESAAREAALHAGRERDRVLAAVDRLRERLTADPGPVFARARKLLGGQSDLPVPEPRPAGDAEASVADARALHAALTALAERLDRVLDERADAEGRLLAQGNAAVDGLLEATASMEELAREVQAATSEAATATVTLDQRVRDLEDRVDRRARLAEDAAAFESRSRLFKALALELRADRLIAFLQAEALQVLAVAGSDRLSDLTGGRYHLTYRDDEFFVVDLWNGEEERSVRTLSGGETFLASLALALALAEQVRSLSVTDRAGLDSLFLDEGFGTLDPDTLRTVIDAIEQLAGDGRLVGVITHVGDLARQFPRIEVSKSPRGSRLEFVAG